MLAVRDGRLLLAAQALDAMAIGVAGVALPWLVLRAGGSHGQAGLVFALTVVPYVVFGLFAGALSDRRSPRLVMLSAHAFQALCATVIPVWTIGGTPPSRGAADRLRYRRRPRVRRLPATSGRWRRWSERSTSATVRPRCRPRGASGCSRARRSAVCSWRWSVPGSALWRRSRRLRSGRGRGACHSDASSTRLRGTSESATPGAIVEGLRYIAANRGVALYTCVGVCTNLVGRRRLRADRPAAARPRGTVRRSRGRDPRGGRAVRRSRRRRWWVRSRAASAPGRCSRRRLSVGPVGDRGARPGHQLRHGCRGGHPVPPARVAALDPGDRRAPAARRPPSCRDGWESPGRMIGLGSVRGRARRCQRAERARSASATSTWRWRAATLVVALASTPFLLRL